MDVWREAQDRIPSKGLRERLGLDDSLGTTAKQIVMVWAFVAKKRR